MISARASAQVTASEIRQQTSWFSTTMASLNHSDLWSWPKHFVSNGSTRPRDERPASVSLSHHFAGTNTPHRPNTEATLLCSRVYLDQRQGRSH